MRLKQTAAALCCVGIGGLGMSIEGPGKVDIKCFESPGGTCRVAYKPTEPGTYQLSVKYAEEHIPGQIQYKLTPQHVFMTS